MTEPQRTNAMFVIAVLVLLFSLAILFKGCNFMEVHIITEVGDGTKDTVTETTRDSASVSLTE